MKKQKAVFTSDMARKITKKNIKKLDEIKFKISNNLINRK